jgi:hypothetical protein
VVFYIAASILDLWAAAIRTAGHPTRILALLGRAWRALPGDLLGLAVMHGCGISSPSRVVEAEGGTVVLVENPRVDRYLAAQAMPIQAQTLGRYVFARSRISDRTLEHELEHVGQWRRLGPLYLPLYFGSSAVALLRGRRPYWDNAFEAAARSRADRQSVAPPGEAVRSLEVRAPVSDGPD